jgi:hypothetical protein
VEAEGATEALRALHRDLENFERDLYADEQRAERQMDEAGTREAANIARGRRQAFALALGQLRRVIQSARRY